MVIGSCCGDSGGGGGIYGPDFLLFSLTKVEKRKTKDNKDKYEIMSRHRS